MTNKLYDFLKNLVLLILPAISAAYWSLSNIWDWSNPEKVTGTIAVFTVFLGAILKISTNQYRSSGNAYDGTIVTQVSENGKLTLTLEFDDEDKLDPLENKGVVSFKVVKSS